MRTQNIIYISIILFLSALSSEAQNIINPSYKKGFTSQIEAGALIHEGFAGEYANISSGYNILPGLFTGIGVGIKNQSFKTPSSTKSVHVPVYAHLKYSFLNKTVSPFVDLKGGIVSDFSGSIKKMPEAYPKYGCGHFFRVGIGVDYKRYSLYFGDDWAQLSYNKISASWSDYAWVIGMAIRF